MCKNNKSSAEESNVGIIDNSMRLAYTNYANVERRPAYGNNYCRSSSSSGLLGLAVRSMIRDKKAGKSLQCGGDCKNCGGHCH